MNPLEPIGPRGSWENRGRDLIFASAHKTNEISVPVAIIRSAVGVFALALLTAVPTGAQTRSIDDGDTVVYSQPSTNARTATLSDGMRPFRVNVPDDALVDLRKRVLATRWPEKETVSDRSQGVQLANLQELLRYWSTDYDWRKVEAKLNALLQFITTIDGLDIHFIHVRSRHPNALPVIITHGWPGRSRSSSRSLVH
jgi:hypothetical protein